MRPVACGLWPVTRFKPVTCTGSVAIGILTELKKLAAAYPTEYLSCRRCSWAARCVTDHASQKMVQEFRTVTSLLSSHTDFYPGLTPLPIPDNISMFWTVFCLRCLTNCTNGPGKRTAATTRICDDGWLPSWRHRLPHFRGNEPQKQWAARPPATALGRSNESRSREITWIRRPGM